MSPKPGEMERRTLRKSTCTHVRVERKMTFKRSEEPGDRMVQLGSVRPNEVNFSTGNTICDFGKKETPRLAAIFKMLKQDLKFYLKTSP